MCVWVLKAFAGQSLKLFRLYLSICECKSNCFYFLLLVHGSLPAPTSRSALISTRIYLFVFALRVCVCLRVCCGEWGWWVWWTHTGIDFATPLPDKLDINHFNDDHTYNHMLIPTHTHIQHTYICIHMYNCTHVCLSVYMYCISSLLYLKYCLNA